MFSALIINEDDEFRYASNMFFVRTECGIQKGKMKRQAKKNLYFLNKRK